MHGATGQPRRGVLNMSRFFIVVVSFAVALTASLCPNNAVAQEKRAEVLEGSLKKYDPAIIKMIAVMHLRREVNEQRLEMLEVAKDQVKKMYSMDVDMRLGSEASKAKALKKLQGLENELATDGVSEWYRGDIFPVLASALRGEEVKGSTKTQKYLLDKVKDTQDRGQRFFELQSLATSLLDREKEVVEGQQADLEERILLFEGLYKKRK